MARITFYGDKVAYTKFGKVAAFLGNVASPTTIGAALDDSCSPFYAYEMCYWLDALGHAAYSGCASLRDGAERRMGD